jgi:spermidine synthase
MTRAMNAMSAVIPRSEQLGLPVFVYALAIFLSSAGALVIEIVAGRMIAPYVGMSLYTWTAIISVVLAGLSVGHWLGGLLSEADAATAHARAAVLLAGAALSVAACLPLIRIVSPWMLSQDVSQVGAIVGLTSALFFLPSLFLGTVSPILTRLALVGRMEAPGPRIGIMFAAGALGSILGTLSAGYLFISWIGTSGTVLSVCGLFALMAGCFLLVARPGRVRAGLTTSFLVLAGGGIFIWADALDALASPCRVESDYYCIRVEDLGTQTDRASRVMVLDHLGHGINDRDEPRFLHSSYLVLADLLVRHRLRPEEGFSAFFIGGGANTLPRAWQAAFPGARLHVSEVDPSVTRVAREAMWFEPGPHTKMDHRDSRVVLAGMPPNRLYDVIVGDAFHDISVPEHLTTVEFARLVRAHLAETGFYTLNVVDSARRPLFLYAASLTLAQVFPQVEVWVDAAQLQDLERLTYLFVAGTHSSGLSQIRAPGPDGTVWRRWPPDDLAKRIVAAGVPVLTDDLAPVDRLMRHVHAVEP